MRLLPWPPDCRAMSPPTQRPLSFLLCALLFLVSTGWRVRRHFHDRKFNLLRRQRIALAVGPMGQRQSHRGLASCGLASDGVP
jgi:hypothetical protein